MKARLPQGYGGGMPSNMNQIARQAQKMQEDMERLKDELAQKEYSASSGGNMVSVTVTGEMEVKSIEIKPEVVDPDDIEMLSDMVMAAVNEALRMASADKEQKLGDVTGGLSIPGLF
ncbi:MAG: YbaB/EbfC family nucleoid-associated protein [Clostridia bacterium]|nr:YbaB/EbfC family nucleoid-associated protein [Clostridia bacterium]